jgi:phosphopantetheine adenylyltransferase / dephospho-CoA kinase
MKYFFLLKIKVYVVGTKSYQLIVETFGEKIITNENKEDLSINRKELGKIVFSDKSEMKKLTDIVWKEINIKIQEKIQENQDKKIIFIEAAVLFEAGFDKLVDECWCFSCPVEETKKRLMERNNLTEEEALKRINSQLSNEEREKNCKVVINTNNEKDITRNIIKNNFDNL